MFFASTDGLSTGVMAFYDALGGPVASLETNGACGGAVMPPRQIVSFPTPAVSATVTSDGQAWIDTLTINPTP